MQTFKYRRNKRTVRLTVMWIGLAAAALILPYFFGEGNYLSAWLIAVISAIVIMYVLSIPVRILTDDELLEIRCVVETTRIEIRDIAVIRKTTPADYKRLCPIIGSYGFFGYYGYYFDFKKWELVKVYTSEWDNLVEIEDIYEDRYIVSCREADKLIDAVMQAKLIHAGE